MGIRVVVLKIVCVETTIVSGTSFLRRNYCLSDRRWPSMYKMSLPTYYISRSRKIGLGPLSRCIGTFLFCRLRRYIPATYVNEISCSFFWILVLSCLLSVPAMIIFFVTWHYQYLYVMVRWHHSYHLRISTLWCTLDVSPLVVSLRCLGKCTNQRLVCQPAFGVPISIPWYSPAKTTLGGKTYQSTYHGTKTLIFTHYLCFFLVVRARNEVYNLCLYVKTLIFTHYLCFFLVVRARNEAYNLCLYVKSLPPRGSRNPVNHGLILALWHWFALLTAQLLRLKTDDKVSCCSSKLMANNRYSYAYSFILWSVHTSPDHLSYIGLL